MLKWYGLNMDNNRYKQDRRRSQQSNIDGFILPVQKQRITKSPLLKQPQSLSPIIDEKPHSPSTNRPNSPTYSPLASNDSANKSWLNASRPATNQSPLHVPSA